jgi:hypothetical protein
MKRAEGMGVKSETGAFFVGPLGYTYRQERAAGAECGNSGRRCRVVLVGSAGHGPVTWFWRGESVGAWART